MKIVNKRKFIRSMIILIVFISITILMGLKSIYSTNTLQYKEEYVYTGDTLWSIAYAEANYNEYYKDKDIRDIIRELKEINSLENSTLYDGQKILIPKM